MYSSTTTTTTIIIIIIEYTLLGYTVKKSKPSLSSKVQEYTRKREKAGTALPERHLCTQR